MRLLYEFVTNDANAEALLINLAQRKQLFFYIGRAGRVTLKYDRAADFATAGAIMKTVESAYAPAGAWIRLIETWDGPSLGGITVLHLGPKPSREEAESYGM